MRILNQEAKNVQNPALGSYIIWQFCISYAKHSNSEDGPPLPLIFLLLPLLFKEDTFEVISSTRKATGLRASFEKLNQSNNPLKDIVLSINKGVIDYKKITLDSLSISVASKLVAIETNSGLVISLTESKPSAKYVDSAKQYQKCAEKLGIWFSNLTIHEVSSLLKVRF